MAKLIFISGTPISTIVGKKYDPDYYEKKGFDVEYWDMTRLYYSEKALSVYFDGHKDFRYQFSKEKMFSSRKEVERELKGIPSNVIFCYTDFNCHNDYWLRRFFKKYDTRYYVGPRRTSECYERKVLSKVVSSYEVLSDMRTLKRIFSYIWRKLCKISYNHTNFYKKPAFVVASGTLGQSEWLNVTRSRHFVSVPSNDLIWHKSPTLIDRPYCAYIDDTVIYSPDQYMDKDKPSTCLNLAEYSNNICKVFNMIEKTLCCQVVIAASGKYEYADNKIFGGRKIIYAKTNQLIQHAEIVVGHASSATWQVIVDLKPVIFLWDPSFIKAKNMAVTLQATFLGAKPIMSTELTPEHLKKEVEINQIHYTDLIESYFCEKGVVGLSHELIARKLEQFCNENHTFH